MEGTIGLIGLFKSAVVIGAGLTVGKYLGEVINAVFNGIGLGIAVIGAEKGNENMQKVCNKYNVKYKKPENDDSPKDKIIGFHCE
jgi:hypothetical protein